MAITGLQTLQSAGAISGWSQTAGNANNGTYNIAFSSDFLAIGIIGGGISLGASGTATLGGILITIGEIGAVVNPITISIVRAIAVGVIAYETYQLYKKQCQAGQAADIGWALDRLRRDCGGAGLTKDQQQKVHDAITGQGYGKEDILDIMKGMIGCK